MQKTCPFFKTNCRTDCMMFAGTIADKDCVIRDALANVFSEEGEIVHLVDAIENIGRAIAGHGAWDDVEDDKHNEPRVIPFDDLVNSTHGMGFIETKIAKEGQDYQSAASWLVEFVWIDSIGFDKESEINILEHKRSYNAYHIPTKLDIKAVNNDDLTMNAGWRVWNAKPTLKQMMETEWDRRDEI